MGTTSLTESCSSLAEFVTAQRAAAQTSILPDRASPFVETSIAEKTQALVRLGLANSRIKDFFDIHALAMARPFDGETLRLAFVGRIEAPSIRTYPSYRHLDGVPVARTRGRRDQGTLVARVDAGRSVGRDAMNAADNG